MLMFQRPFKIPISNFRMCAKLRFSKDKITLTLGSLIRLLVSILNKSSLSLRNHSLAHIRKLDIGILKGR